MLGIWTASVDGFDAVGAEHDVVDAVFGGWTNCDLLAGERAGDPHATTLESDPALAVDTAHGVVRPVRKWRDLLAERPGTCDVVIGRNIEAKGVVRSLGVIDLPPAIEGLLGVGEIVEVAKRQEFSGERAVE